MRSIESLVRENIRNIKPYASARSEFSGNAKIFLDANENSFGSPIDVDYSRYPDPLQRALKAEVSKIKGVRAENQFVGNGSDEIIDVLIRVFCEPKKDNILVCPPTYDMYETWANINDVETRKVNLLSNFQLDLEHLPTQVDENTKIIFLCTPNNPTGNSLEREDIEFVLNNFDGLVVVDEAYVNFAQSRSFIKELEEYPNLFVLQTLSKAWGLAGLRIGVGFASEEILYYMNKVKPPYNLNEASITLGVEALKNVEGVNQKIKSIVSERNRLEKALIGNDLVEKVFESDTNFLLVRFKIQPDDLYQYLLEKGVVVRNRSKAVMCDNCLRITVGTEDENTQLLNHLSQYVPQKI